MYNCQSSKLRKSGNLTAQEIVDAEEVWIREIQQRFSSMQLKQLKHSLGLFVDNKGIIRSRGRIAKTNLPYEMKHPALLYSNHHVTELIVRNCHVRVKHNGVKETLAELRTRYWLIRGRQVVKRIIFSSVCCKKLEGKPYQNPSAGDIPSFRLEDELAFTNVGVDFAGPLFINVSKDQASPMVKAYIALYTCASSHAVHLELGTSLTAESFLRCFRCFISRRGIPRLMVSDNAKTFKSASGTLEALFNLPSVQAYFSENKIRWRFNLEKAPGGVASLNAWLSQLSVVLKSCFGMPN